MPEPAVDWTLIWELFRFALAAALVAGAICPLIGCFLFLRRTSFYGITLPQFAAAGVAAGFAVMPWWVSHVGIGDLDLHAAMEDSHAAMNYHIGWAALLHVRGSGGTSWPRAQGRIRRRGASRQRSPSRVRPPSCSLTLHPWARSSSTACCGETSSQSVHTSSKRSPSSWASRSCRSSGSTEIS